MTMMATVQENGRAVQPAPSAQAPVPAAATKQNGYPAKAAPATANGPGDGASSPPSQSLYDVCVELRDKIEAFLAEKIPDSEPRLQAVQKQLRVSMDVVEEALSRYPMEELSLSYNGGKDCLVLLIVILACLGRHFAPPTTCARRPADSPSKSAAEVAPTTNGNTAQQPQPAETRIEADTTGSAPAVQPVDAASSSPSTTTSSSCSSSSSSSRSASVSFPTSLQAVCIAEPHPFESLDAFVASSAKRYHLDLSRYTLPMRQGLEAYLRDRPSVKAVFVGTRRTDPHGENLRHFDPTDKGWPQFVRVHPVIDWHYAEIWAFIRHLGIPYCPLYDLGYTSLGGTRDTHPNPQLKKEGTGEGGEHGEASFRPAYELMDDEEERLGRY